MGREFRIFLADWNGLDLPSSWSVSAVLRAVESGLLASSNGTRIRDLEKKSQ